MCACPVERVKMQYMEDVHYVKDERLIGEDCREPIWYCGNDTKNYSKLRVRAWPVDGAACVNSDRRTADGEARF